MLNLADEFGPPDLDGLGAKVRHVPYTYSDSFTALATLATKEGSIKIDGDSAFVIDFPVIDCSIVAAIDSSLAGTPLLREPYGDSLGNEIPSLSLCTIDITVNGRRLMNKAVPVTAWTGTGQRPGYPLTKIWVPAGATFFYSLYNGTTVSINGHIALRGKRVYRN